MTALLPPNLLKLFAPRPPVPYLKPLTRDENVRGPNKLVGIASLKQRLKEEADDDEIKQGLADKPVTRAEGASIAEGSGKGSKANGNGTKDGDGDVEMGEVKEENGYTDRSAKGSKDSSAPKVIPGKNKKGKERKLPKPKNDRIAKLGVVGQEARKMRKEERVKRKEQYKKDSEANYKPNEDPAAAGDPYKTLFISRLSKKVTEDDLRREFEIYGTIERIRLVVDRKGHSKSYAFIVYERERDMKAAYKDAEGIPIHNKKILVDVERGRTVKGWKPQKLGGGLGGRPKPVKPEELAPPPMMGGFVPRGGFRGGFGGDRGGGFRGGGGGFRGGFGGGDRGGGFGGRGGFGGDRGGFGGDRGGFRGGFGGGDRGGGGGGGFRGGFGGGDQAGGGGGGYGGGGRGGFQQNQVGIQDSGYGGGRGGMGGGGGGFGGRGGFQGGGGGGYGQQADGPPGGYGQGPPGGGYKRDLDGGGGAGGGGGYAGGAYGGGGPVGGSDGGYGGDRDSKRPRY